MVVHLIFASNSSVSKGHSMLGVHYPKTCGRLVQHTLLPRMRFSGVAALRVLAKRRKGGGSTKESKSERPD
jgi:hypothetical protein